MYKDLLNYLSSHSRQSSKEIFDGLGSSYSYATVKRALSKLVRENVILSKGKGRGTRYEIGPSYKLLKDINAEKYFEEEQDNRQIEESFNLSLITEVLNNAKIFTPPEKLKLEALQFQFKKNIAHLSKSIYAKEMERLAIDLSWKSSQIEGNRYSLLETERLLIDKETAAGKPKDDAIMLLNHKEAINFMIANPDYVVPLTVRSIEDIQSILIKDLGVDQRHQRR